MSATQKIKHIKKLGIIAGGGQLPAYLVDVCNEKKIDTYVAALNMQCDKNIDKSHSDSQIIWANLGSAGKIINFFKQNGVCDLVMIGSIKRPKLFQIKPDLKAVQILSRIGYTFLGDNSLLVALKKELEKEGFTVHGIQDFCDKLLMPNGALGDYESSPHDQSTIELGIKKSQEIGAKDIGQSVVVQNNQVIGVEDSKGTDDLIKRAATLLQNTAEKGILVKTCKPQQDITLDLPTIGIDTIKNAHKAGLKGIVLHAGYTLLIDPKNIAEYANKYRMFVLGVEI